MNRPPSNQFYPYATGGHAVYMNTNDASAAPPPNNGHTSDILLPDNRVALKGTSSGSQELKAVKHQLESDNKGTPADQQLVKYPPPQHQVQQGGQQQPSSVNPRDQIETGRWAAGLCSCCDNCVPNCMMTMCLPFVSLAQIYSRMGLMPFSAGLLVFFILYAISFSSNFLPNTTETTTVRYSYGGYTSYQTVVYSTPNPMVLPLTAAGLAGQLVFRLFVWRARAAIRGRYDIPGSCCGDCCAVYWCSCCAVAQMATHVKSYRPGSCGFGAPATLPAYVSS
ncbi:hypothetical protein PybrP1_010177 [[Pythium] brassicae (nom. inval.)]|nr:hypothetical protein PybrP1_010177 [[Pythium] brassicae (nom. inval.)]